jgi:hypothetical protein
MRTLLLGLVLLLSFGLSPMAEAAVSITRLTQGCDNTDRDGTTDYQTDPITPTAGRPIVVALFLTSTGGLTEVFPGTVSGAGIASFIESNFSQAFGPGDGWRVRFLHGSTGSPATGPLTIDPGEAATGACWVVSELVNGATTQPGDSQGTGSGTDTVASENVTIDPAGGINLCTIGLDTSGGITVDLGTELAGAEVSMTSPTASMDVGYRLDSDFFQFSFASSQFGMMCVEFLEGAGGGGPSGAQPNGMTLLGTGR